MPKDVKAIEQLLASQLPPHQRTNVQLGLRSRSTASRGLHHSVLDWDLLSGSLALSVHLFPDV